MKREEEGEEIYGSRDEVHIDKDDNQVQMEEENDEFALEDHIDFDASPVKSPVATADDDLDFQIALFNSIQMANFSSIDRSDSPKKTAPDFKMKGSHVKLFPPLFIISLRNLSIYAFFFKLLINIYFNSLYFL